MNNIYDANAVFQGNASVKWKDEKGVDQFLLVPYGTKNSVKMSFVQSTQPDDVIFTVTKQNEAELQLINGKENATVAWSEDESVTQSMLDFTFKSKALGIVFI